MKKRNSKSPLEILPLGKPFVTPEEIAPILRRTPRSIRMLMEDGLLPGTKFGSRWVMHRADFDALTKPKLQESTAD